MIRPIVEDAFECYALRYQFEAIDIPDKLLAEATEACVNETYDDAYLIKEARYLLDGAILRSNRRSRPGRTYPKTNGAIDIEVRQLEAFLQKHA